jgi:hypothetical protein
MKKILLLLTVSFALFSCGGEKEHPKPGKWPLPVFSGFEINLSITDPPITDSFPDMTAYGIVKPLVDNYIADLNIIPSTFCFTFNSNLIQRYIDSCKSPIIQFFLAEDTPIGGKINYYMVAAMVDSSGSNTYLNYTNKDKVLSHCVLKCGNDILFYTKNLDNSKVEHIFTLNINSICSKISKVSSI